MNEEEIMTDVSDDRRFRLKGPVQYGSKGWRIDTNAHPGEKAAQIYVMADAVEFKDGAVIFWGGFRAYSDDGKPDEKIPVLALAPGQWSLVAPISAWDGSEVAIEGWYPIDPKTGKRGENLFCRHSRGDD